MHLASVWKERVSSITLIFMAPTLLEHSSALAMSIWRVVPPGRAALTGTACIAPRTWLQQSTNSARGSAGSRPAAGTAPPARPSLARAQPSPAPSAQQRPPQRLLPPLPRAPVHGIPRSLTPVPEAGLKPTINADQEYTLVPASLISLTEGAYPSY